MVKPKEHKKKTRHPSDEVPIGATPDQVPPWSPPTPRPKQTPRRCPSVTVPPNFPGSVTTTIIPLIL